MTALSVESAAPATASVAVAVAARESSSGDGEPERRGVGDEQHLDRGLHDPEQAQQRVQLQRRQRASAGVQVAEAVHAVSNCAAHAASQRPPRR